MIIYDGPSAIDGKPIVAIATFGSKNPKTGPMVQVWILLKDESPVSAVHSGADSSICGDCPLRGYLEKQDDGSTRNRDRACYVTVHNAPNAVWNAYKRNRYERYTGTRKQRKLFRGVGLRIGAYGEPTAIPLKVMYPFIKMSSHHTGYTHQWKQKRFARWKQYLMASADNAGLASIAQSMGWRTFRVKKDTDPVLSNESVCPASAEAGKKVSCDTCKLCSGNTISARNIVIDIHNSPLKMKGAKRTLSRIVDPQYQLPVV